MTYTSPRTWVVGELVTAALLNVHLRDNLAALKAPPTAKYLVNEGADYTTTSSSFADVDATDLNLSITTTGGDVLVTFVGSTNNSGANAAYFDLIMDGATRAGGDDGLLLHMGTAGTYLPVVIIYLYQSVSAGVHTFKLQWKVAAGTQTMSAGAGTSAKDVHPYFLAREVS